MKKFYNREKVKSALSFLQGIKSFIIICMMIFSSLQGYSQYQTPFQTSSLNGTNGFGLYGVRGFEKVGEEVSSAGDINGDGYEDFLVNAPGMDADNGPGAPDTNEGAVFLVFGKAGNYMESIDLENLGSDGFVIKGLNVEDHLGLSITSANINGDAYSDFILTNFTTLYVIYGKATGWTSAFDLSGLNGTNGFTVTNFNTFNQTVRNAGDMNGDGLDDIIFGYPDGGAGASYVIFGSTIPFPAIIDISTVVLDGANGFSITGEDIDDQAGYKAAGIGDVNGDGFDDVMVTNQPAPYNVFPDFYYYAEAYVVFGHAPPFTSSINLSTLDGTNGFKVEGFYTTAQTKYLAPGRVGDINDDGIDDIAIGDYVSDIDKKGITYILFGKETAVDGDFNATEDVSLLNGTTGFSLIGDDDDLSGFWISGNGDLNSDGIDDFIIGAPSLCAGLGCEVDSKAYVVYGSSSLTNAQFDLTALDGENGFKFDGVGGVGISSAFADIDNDGVEDIIIGAFRASKPFTSTGSGGAYVLFGRAKVTNCAVPTGLAVMEINPYQVEVSWNDVNPGEKYEVEYKQTVAGAPVESVTVVENTSIALDITPGQQYKFRIRGVCIIEGIEVQTAYTDWVYLTNTSGCIIPDGLGTLDLDNTTVTLTWNDVNPGQDYFVRYKPTIAGSPWIESEVENMSELDVIDLEVDQQYKFQVQAVCDLSGDIVTSDFSELFFFTTTVNGCDEPATLFVTGVDNTSATLNWVGDPSGDYEILFKPTTAGVPFQMYSVSGALSLGPPTISGLDPGKSHKFAVRQKCVIDGKTVYTQYSPYFIFSTTATGCDPPTGLNSNPVAAQTATINWTESGNYVLQYKPTISGFAKTGILVSGVSQPLSGLVPNQRYKYRLIQICDLGGGTNVASAPSAWSFFTTDALGTTAIQADNRTMENPEKQQLELDFERVLTMYPVPTRDVLQLDFNPENEGKGVVSIVSALGRRVLQKEFSNRFVETIDMRGRESGVYFVRILYNGTTISDRFVHLGQ